MSKEKALRILGWIMVAIPGGWISFVGCCKIMGTEGTVEQLTKYGLLEHATFIGLLQVVGGVLLLIPRAAIFGAALITAIMGGAISVHMQVGEAGFLAMILTVVAWFGVGLREPHLIFGKNFTK